MMLLQDLFKEENKNLSSVFGITLDKDSQNAQYANLPENIKELGFVFVLDDEGTIDETLMDLIITYKLNNIEVVVEVPIDLLVNKKITPAYLMQLASNIGFAISLLPPKHPINDVAYSFEEYQSVLLAVLKEMQQRPNFDKPIYPINSYFDYLILEKVVGEQAKEKFKPTDSYILNHYIKYVTEEQSDAFKEAIKNSLYDFYGGQESFDIMISSMIESLYDKSKDIYTDYIKKINNIQ